MSQNLHTAVARSSSRPVHKLHPANRQNTAALPAWAQGASDANRYAKYTGKPLEEIEAAVDRDNWLDAKEAMDFGLVDKVFETRPEGEANTEAEGSGGAPE